MTVSFFLISIGWILVTFIMNWRKRTLITLLCTLHDFISWMLKRLGMLIFYYECITLLAVLHNFAFEIKIQSWSSLPGDWKHVSSTLNDLLSYFHKALDLAITISFGWTNILGWSGSVNGRKRRLLCWPWPENSWKQKAVVLASWKPEQLQQKQSDPPVCLTIVLAPSCLDWTGSRWEPWL